MRTSEDWPPKEFNSVTVLPNLAALSTEASGVLRVGVLHSLGITPERVAGD
jgi:hypothetical protein